MSPEDRLVNLNAKLDILRGKLVILSVAKDLFSRRATETEILRRLRRNEAVKKLSLNGCPIEGI